VSGTLCRRARQATNATSCIGPNSRLHPDAAIGAASRAGVTRRFDPVRRHLGVAGEERRVVVVVREIFPGPFGKSPLATGGWHGDGVRQPIPFFGGLPCRTVSYVDWSS
jgi:hypothetical protein